MRDVTTPALNAETIAALRDLGDEEFLCEVLSTFTAQAEQLEEPLREAFLAQDPIALARAAHALKGSCLSVGALRLAGLAEKIEISPEVAEHDLKVLLAELARVCAECDDHLVTSQMGTAGHDGSRPVPATGPHREAS